MATCPKCLSRYPDDVTVCAADGTSLVPDSMLGVEPELATGSQVGEYVIEAKVGAGTFGSVYRGIQPLIGKQVAVKVLSRKYSADPTVVSRFIAEARAVNQIRHTNIIDIFSFGQLEDGRHYHVMELLDGAPLDEHVDNLGGRIPVTTLVPILKSLARALDAAHAAGIAHRDLKPANVFLARDEDGLPFPKLLDFGIAKLLADEMPRQHSTATGAAVGTPDYMSPEQCQGPDVDHRTDIYALGIMTYQLLTGHLPHRGGNVVEVLMKQMTAEPTPPSQVVPDIPATFDGPVLAMMAKLPEDRPQTCYLAIQALINAVLEEGYDIPSASHSDEQVGLEHFFAGKISGAANPKPADTLGRTLPSSPGHSAADLATPSHTRNRLAVAVGLAVMVSAAAGVPLLLGGEGGPSEPISESTQPMAMPESEPEPDIPAPSSTVEIIIVGAPNGAHVFGPGGVDLGDASERLALPQGAEPLRLVIRAEGFRDLEREIVPIASGTISVSMFEERRATGKQRRRGSRTRPKKELKKQKNKDDLELPNWD